MKTSITRKQKKTRNDLRNCFNVLLGIVLQTTQSTQQNGISAVLYKRRWIDDFVEWAGFSDEDNSWVDLVHNLIPSMLAIKPLGVLSKSHLDTRVPIVYEYGNDRDVRATHCRYLKNSL